MRKLTLLLSCAYLFVLCSCSETSIRKKDYEKLPAITENGTLNMVVEIPAGTNQKYEYDSSSKSFEVEIINNKKRVVNFLPYPGNYGFIPSTLMEEERGGDGDALDILLISESVKRGTVVDVIPIATLILKDNDEVDTKIIAVPLDTTLSIIDARSYQVFLIEYDAVKRIIEEWFTHYKGDRQIELVGWKDENYAWKEVEKWLKKD
jgi:inorganic pyrophosphatase